MDNQNELNSIDPQAEKKPEPSYYNPLMDVVSEKPYSVQNIAVDQNELANSIPEPTYQPQSIGGRQNPYKTIRDGGSMMGAGADDSDAKTSSFNPSMNEVPDAEKKEGAKHLAKLIVDGYEQLNGFANMGLQFSQRKLRKLESEGEIDLSIPIPDGYGNTITAGNFIEEFNEQSKDTLTVSPQFKKEVTPILERVLAKRGAGLTDEQMLMYIFGKDIAVKGVLFYQMKTQMSDMVDIIKEQTAAYKEGNGVKAKPKADTKTYNDKTTQPYGYSPTPSVDNDVSDFNFQTNETVMNATVQQMETPKTGKERLFEQRAKEKKWKQDAENVSKPSNYQEAMAQRKTGKRGRKKTIRDYVNGVDKESIVDSIILTETKDNEENLND
ncbi:MAG: hypothetical protein ACOVNU_09185 [Candidatus Kapaibacteriota bacterium]